MNAFWDKSCGSKLYLVERDAIGRVSIRGEPADFCCFARREELSPELERKLRASSRVSAIAPADGGRHVRVRWKDRWSCIEAAQKGGAFERAGVGLLEADVDPVRRYLTDNPGRKIARPRRCYLDLEADSRVPPAEKERARMLAWAVFDEAGEKRGSGALAEDSDEAERAMLEALWRTIDRFDQVVAWAGDFYDFPYLLARTRRQRLAIDERRWLWLDQLTLFRRMNLGGTGDEKQSLKLGSIGHGLVGVGKSKLEGDEARAILAYLDTNGPTLHARFAAMFHRDGAIEISGADSWPLWEAGGPARDLLLRYCERDTWLCSAIEKKTGFVDILFALCEVSRCFADSKGILPTRQVEGFMLRLGSQRGMRFRTHHFSAEQSEKFGGAFVLEPTRLGIVRDVQVCDFERLYPSVAMTFNLSAETVEGRDPRVAHAGAIEPAPPDGRARVPITRVLVRQEPRGLLPIAFEELLALRQACKDAKKRLPPGSPEWIDADRRDDAYKRAINAFFGVHGNDGSRFRDRDVAESMTQGGVWLIKETLRAASLRGWEGLYGDTDSAFLLGPTDDEMRSFVASCNAELFPRLVRERGAARNHIALAYEKKFAIAVFLGKKRYAARYAHYKNKVPDRDAELEVKGLEFRRGDTLRLARELQKRAIEMLLRDEVLAPGPYGELLDAYRRRVLEDDLPLADLVISKRLAKPLGMYARRTKKDGDEAAQAAHVEVARVLKERGHDVRQGTKIDYVVTDGAANPAVAIPAEDYEGQADRFYLWENLIFPPTERVLQAAFPAHDWSPWERVRPRAPRRKGKPVDPRQLGLPFD